MFQLNEEQQAIQETTAEFAREVLLSTIRERDDSHEDASSARASLMEMGFGGMTLSEELGGLDLDILSISLVLEEIAKVDPALALQLAWHNVWCLGLLQRGTDSSRSPSLEAIATGEALACWAGSCSLDAKEENGQWILNGRISSVPGLKAAGYVFFHRQDEESETVFALSMKDSGLSVQDASAPLTLHTAAWGDLLLENCKATPLLASADTASVMHDLGVQESLALASIGLGQMRGAFELSRLYASERVQFGRSIDKFEAIRFKLGEMTLMIERLSALRAGAAESFTQNGPERAAQVCDMARLDSAIGAAYCGREGVQIHGGYGYSREYHAERFMRDSRFLASIAGGVEVLRDRISTRCIG
jgi:alkylation response protein AidB-like acyl-CoA dehydrogenase